MATELFVDPGTELVRGAVLSDDGLYRYRLWRTWEPLRGRMAFVMLNPSTADAEVDDPTIRRCMGFARREGCGGIEVINLYGLRATKPEHLLDHPDPEGPENWKHWHAVLSDHSVDFAVAAWGAHCHMGGLPASGAFWSVMGAVSWWCFGWTKAGDPRHPLYLRADAELEQFTASGPTPVDPLPTDPQPSDVPDSAPTTLHRPESGPR